MFLQDLFRIRRINFRVFRSRASQTLLLQTAEETSLPSRKRLFLAARPTGLKAASSPRFVEIARKSILREEGRGKEFERNLPPGNFLENEVWTGENLNLKKKNYVNIFASSKTRRDSRGGLKGWNEIFEGSKLLVSKFTSTLNFYEFKGYPRTCKDASFLPLPRYAPRHKSQSAFKLYKFRERGGMSPTSRNF